jgi:hypothetical protein
MHVRRIARAVAALALTMGLAQPAEAQSVSISGSVWFAGPNGSGDATYSGALDQPPALTSSTISGWVVDTSAQGWSGIDDVQIWSGPMDAGGQLVTHPTIQLNRPDVASALGNPYWAASGFSGTLSSSPWTTATSLYVYAHTPAKGWWYNQFLVSPPIGAISTGPRIDIEIPTPLATVHNSTAYVMSGTAYDPSSTTGTGVDRVSVYLNGDRKTGVYIGDATLGHFDKFSAQAGAQFANAGWQLTFQPSSWIDTQTDNTIMQLTVYAHSSVTAMESSVQTSIVVSLP